jgi:hypothetical protein
MKRAIGSAYIPERPRCIPEGVVQNPTNEIETPVQETVRWRSMSAAASRAAGNGDVYRPAIDAFARWASSAHTKPRGLNELLAEYAMDK